MQSTPSPCNRPLIIGFTGRAGAGKTTAAEILIEHLGFTRGKFAAALKDMLRALLRYRGADAVLIERMVEGDLKEVPSPLLNGRTPRYVQQTLGTEWGREMIDPNLWTDTELEVLRGVHLIVVEDVRFFSEGERLRAEGAFLIEIVNPRLPTRRNDLLSRLLRWAAWIRIHVSESMPVQADLRLVNGGTKEQLRDVLITIVASLIPRQTV